MNPIHGLIRSLSDFAREEPPPPRWRDGLATSAAWSLTLVCWKSGWKPA